MATCPHCRHRFRFRSLQKDPARITEIKEPASFAPKREESRPAAASAPAAAPKKTADSPAPEKSAPAAQVRQNSAAAPKAESPADKGWNALKKLGDRVSKSLPSAADDKTQPDGTPKPTPAEQDYAERHTRWLDPDEAEAGQVASQNAENPADSAAAASSEAPHASPVLGTPWENRQESDGFFSAFYQTCLGVMFSAAQFFGRLNPSAQQNRALSFYLIVSMLQIVLERFWGQVMSAFLLSNSANDPQLQHLAEILAPTDNVLLTLLLRCAALTLELYVMSIVFLGILRFLAPGKGDFATVFQVVAYSSAPVLLSVVPVVGSVAGTVWSIGCCITGIKYAMRLNWGQAALVVLPIYMLLIALLLQLSAVLAAM